MEEVAECEKCVGSACCGREYNAMQVDTIVTDLEVSAEKSRR